jgi:superfamily II DNA or RNA helicase
MSSETETEYPQTYDRGSETETDVPRGFTRPPLPKQKRAPSGLLLLWNDVSIGKFISNNFWKKVNREFKKVHEIFSNPYTISDGNWEGLVKKWVAALGFNKSRSNEAKQMRALAVAISTYNWMVRALMRDRAATMLEYAKPKIAEHSRDTPDFATYYLDLLSVFMKDPTRLAKEEMIVRDFHDAEVLELDKTGKELKKKDRELEKKKKEREMEEKRTCSSTVWSMEDVEYGESGHEMTGIFARRYSAPHVLMFEEEEFVQMYGKDLESLKTASFESGIDAVSGMFALWLHEYTKSVPGSRFELVPFASRNDLGKIVVAKDDRPGKYSYVEFPEAWSAWGKGVKPLKPDEVSNFLCDTFLSEPRVQPLPHQRLLLDYLTSNKDILWPSSDPDKRGLLLMWKMGSGKTRAAGQIVELLARKVEDFEGVVVIAHKSNLGNWANTLKRMPQPLGTSTKFQIVTRQSFVKLYARPEELKGMLVVVDESQVYQNVTKDMLYEIQLIRGASQILCLSGTPIMNDVNDVSGFLMLTLGWTMDQVDEWIVAYSTADLGSREMKRQLERLEAACRGRISYFDPQIHTPEMFAEKFPEIVWRNVKVTTTWMQAIQHQIFETKMFVLPHPGKSPITFTLLGNSYKTKTKTALLSTYELEKVKDQINSLFKKITRSNGDVKFASADEDLVQEILEASPKFKAVLNNVEEERVKNPGKPQVVHSHFVQEGSRVFVACLGVSYPDFIVRAIEGSDHEDKRTELVTAFSKRKPPPGADRPIDVLVISDASSVGTDLLGAAALHLMSRPDNRATENQTLGRVVRYGSHAKGDKVTIYRYVMTFAGLNDDDMTDDDVDYIASTIKKDSDLIADLTPAQIRRGLSLTSDTRTYEESLEDKFKEKDSVLNPILNSMISASINMK